MKHISHAFAILTVFIGCYGFAEEVTPERIDGTTCWIDPRLEEARQGSIKITAWFDEQFLGDGEAYNRRIKEFYSMGRREMRQKVRALLHRISHESQQQSRHAIQTLEKKKIIQNIIFHWIVNSFSCSINASDVEQLTSVPGVRAIFFAGEEHRERRKNFRVSARDELSKSHPFQDGDIPVAWYIKALNVDQAWKKLGVTGTGVLNVIHDGNFIISPTILPTRYRNSLEKRNGVDDDGNGLIDDLHGFDFDRGTGNLLRNDYENNRSSVGGKLLHGHQCAVIICGRTAGAPEKQFGIAPNASWAGVLASPRSFEQAFEWAINHDADTYSMSFSIPHLGEYRSHWRKACEHASFCGVHLVSGAGNFAKKESPQFAPVPRQMRTPEDIPMAVFAATGVQRDLSRTPFSSQGPVEWNTYHYREGSVKKPVVSAFNFRLPSIQKDGTVIEQGASGNSFAGPMICGTIALMLSANPELKPWETREILASTACDIAAEGYDYQTGFGLVDAYQAVAVSLRQRKDRQKELPTAK